MDDDVLDSPGVDIADHEDGRLADQGMDIDLVDRPETDLKELLAVLQRN